MLTLHVPQWPRIQGAETFRVPRYCSNAGPWQQASLNVSHYQCASRMTFYRLQGDEKPRAIGCIQEDTTGSRVLLWQDCVCAVGGAVRPFVSA